MVANKEEIPSVNLQQAHSPLEAAIIQVKNENLRLKKLFRMMPIGKTKSITGYQRTSEMRLIWPRWSRNTPGSFTSFRLLMTRSSYIGQFSTTVCLSIKEFLWRKSKLNSRRSFEDKRLNLRPKWIRWTKNLKEKWISNRLPWELLQQRVSLKAHQLRVQWNQVISNFLIK